jgi:hypothetical protein
MTPITSRVLDDEPPSCKHCGGVMALMGKLPAMGLKPFIKVFRREGCRHISWTEN